SATGDPVRLLSILVDSGVIDENAARQTVTEVQKSWKFCKYCLSSFRSDGNGSDACSVCGRPLAVAARTYEIVKLSTMAEHGGSGPVAADRAKIEAAKAALPMPE